jgi:NAD(P)-dependent dehydrogenase (short-subunit alcohol dehydrogenase family)
MQTAVVVGASGGIGRALTEHLAQIGRYDRVLAFSRRPAVFGGDGRIISARMDLTDEASIDAGARDAGQPELVIVATGVLQTERIRPERTYRAIDAGAMVETFRINTLGPALVAKAFLPRLPKDRPAVFAVLSARVGSISDNRLGGWHAYRASKAALNMLICNFALELARERPLAVCVGLHPGTVETALSKPFQRGVPATQLFTPAYSAACMLNVLDGLTPSDSGGVFAWDGARIAP